MLLIDKASKKLSVTRQCELLSIAKSSYYYQAKPESSFNLKLMELIDKQYLKYPHMGVPSMTTWLRMDNNLLVNHKRISRLYKLMDLQALIPGPHTSKGNKEHKIYPYLLRNRVIKEVNEVWATDITYIPMKRGFMYLMAVIDLRSRYIVGWSISNTMEAEWCKSLMQECIERHGKPQIVNTDQGAQFTSAEFTGYLLGEGIQISMDGKGRATDNIFIERFWRNVKYEKIYKYSYEDGQQLTLGLVEYMSYYNEVRRHSSLENQRPIEVFENEKRYIPIAPNVKSILVQPQDLDKCPAAGATQDSLAFE